MGGFVVGEVFVAEDFEEYAVGVPWCAGADEFAVCGAQRVEDGVVEFLVVSHKIELISVNHMQGWSSDGFRVVWESLNRAAVGEVNLGALGLKRIARWQLAGESSMRDRIRLVCRQIGQRCLWRCLGVWLHTIAAGLQQ